MRDLKRSLLALAAPATIAMVLGAGCAMRPAVAAMTAPPPVTQPSRVEHPAQRGERGERTSMSPPKATMRPADAARPAPKDFGDRAALHDIHFEFDKYEVTASEARILDGDAQWLKVNASNWVLIEGHADERGTNEYNLALGDRRAKATLNYLVSRGVSPTRVTIISYGEERPLCTEHTEGCWAQNRRAHLRVKEQ